MRLPFIPLRWPYASETDWLAFRDALAHVTAPEAEYWRTECRRELERIARCRSAPAEPHRHTLVPGLDEHPAGWRAREA
jgi:hypothetical protein